MERIKEFINKLFGIGGENKIFSEIEKIEKVSKNLNLGVIQCRQDIDKNDIEISKLRLTNDAKQLAIKRANGIIDKISALLRE